MRFFFWFVVVNALLTLAQQGLAQDSLLYTTTTPLTLNPSTVIDASTALKWRLSGTLGYHRQLQNNPGNESLYLTNGLQAMLAADYFVGSNWGLGVQIGYQNLVVNDAFKRDKVVPLNSFLLPLTSLHSFMLTAGPVFSLPVSQRITLDFDVRGGGFYNDAPTLRAYDIDTKYPSLTITPSDQRFSFGANGSLGLKYQLTQQLAIGVSGNVSYTSFNYVQVSSTSANQYRVNLNMYGVQASLAYRFLTKSKQVGAATATPAVAPKPICYPPVLDTSQPTEFEIGNERPVIKWRSSAPVYTEGERYVFRLYTLPGNKLLYERTVQDPQFNWPTQLTLPDTASYYYYSIFTNRNDDAEQTCRSEPVVGTFGFFSRQSASTPLIPRATSREITYAFTLRLYALQPTLVYEKANIVATPNNTNTMKRASKTTRSERNRPAKKANASPAPDTVRTDSSRLGTVQSDSVRARLAMSDSVKADSASAHLAVSDSTKADSMVTSMKIVPNLIHEESIQQPNFVWPGNVVLPSQPTVYQYTIIRNSDRELIQSYYLMVEPDGCSQIINEAMKNKYLRNTISSTKSVPDVTQPTNKGQP